MAMFQQLKRQTSSNHKNMLDPSRAWVSTDAADAWRKFWTSPLAPADFEVLKSNWHPKSSFYVTSGTLRFKFLTQAPPSDTNLKFHRNSKLNKFDTFRFYGKLLNSLWIKFQKRFFFVIKIGKQKTMDLSKRLQLKLQILRNYWKKLPKKLKKSCTIF